MKVLSKIFTFHNVSINTDKQCSKLIREATLHSTMFLLIPGQQRRSTRRKEPLHSTMFLLIQPDRSENEWQWRTFTFHNVSINTDVWMCLHTSIWTLHSTMFLLILLVQADHIVLLFFTFHNVSINTPPSIHPYNTDIILPLSVNLVTSLFLYLFLSFWTALIFEIFLISQALSTSWSFYSIWRRQS